MKTARETIAEMLTENTGQALCDSGGAYGRNHEKNHGKTLAQWEAEPTVTVDDLDGVESSEDICYTISVFHYLAQQLELDDICREFNAMPVDDWDGAEVFEAYGVSRDGGQWLFDRFDPLQAQSGSWNTYNHECHLSQVLQGRNLVIDGECYVLIQVHGGCDVRGGYTDAKLFKLDNDYCYDGGFLAPQDVYGMVGEKQASNSYDGWSITDDNGNHIDMAPGVEVGLDMYIGG